jgi:hypothetical protein
MCRVTIKNLYIPQNDHLADIRERNEPVRKYGWELIGLRKKGCLYYRINDEKKHLKLLLLKEDISNLVKDYFTSVNMGWLPAMNEDVFWVTVTDVDKLKTMHCKKDQRNNITLTNYNYYRTKIDAEGLIMAIHALIKQRLP